MLNSHPLVSAQHPCDECDMEFCENCMESDVDGNKCCKSCFLFGALEPGTQLIVRHCSNTAPEQHVSMVGKDEKYRKRRYSEIEVRVDGDGSGRIFQTECRVDRVRLSGEMNGT